MSAAAAVASTAGEAAAAPAVPEAACAGAAAEGSGGNNTEQQQQPQQQQQAPGLGAQGRKVSTQDIQLVQNLIERCLQMYMSRREVRAPATWHQRRRVSCACTACGATVCNIAVG